jgi:hypothetical protein
VAGRLGASGPRLRWPARLRFPGLLRFPARLRFARLATALASAVTAAGILATGFWLGGYPGLIVLPAATGLFLAAASYRRSRRCWRELHRPLLLAALLLAASACAAAGEQLRLAAATGPFVTGLGNVIPQVICLIIIGRLVAALILPDP